MYIVTFIPLPQVPKVVYDIASPPEIQIPICCVNFFYEYKFMLIGNTCIRGGGRFKKLFHFQLGIYNGKTYDFSSKISYNIEWNSVKFL